MTDAISRHELTRRMARITAAFPKQFAGPLIGISVYPGWLDLFENLCAGIDQAIQEHGNRQTFRWRQVKEKFGILRAYYGADVCGPNDGQFSLGRIWIWLLGGDDESNSKTHMPAQWAKIRALVNAAQDASGITCMFCGALGSLRTNGWMFTACEAHIDARVGDDFR